MTNKRVRLSIQDLVILLLILVLAIGTNIVITNQRFNAISRKLDATSKKLNYVHGSIHAIKETTDEIQRNQSLSTPNGSYYSPRPYLTTPPDASIPDLSIPDLPDASIPDLSIPDLPDVSIPDLEPPLDQ